MSARCKGFSQCDKLVAWTCADCQRPLCSFHSWGTACGPHGTHRHRQHRTEERERVRTRPGGDGASPHDSLRVPKLRVPRVRRPAQDWSDYTEAVISALRGGKTTAEVAASSGVPAWAIRQMRKAHGITGRARSGPPVKMTSERIAEAVALRKSGHTAAQAAAQLGVAEGTIKTLTRPFGPFERADKVAQWKLDTIRESWGKMPGKEIAARVGISPSHVSHLAHDMGLPKMRAGRHPNEHAAHVPAIVAAIQRGLPCQEIAEQLDLPLWTVRQVRKAHGPAQRMTA